jgi:hypothetical protein
VLEEKVAITTKQVLDIVFSDGEQKIYTVFIEQSVEFLGIKRGRHKWNRRKRLFEPAKKTNAFRNQVMCCVRRRRRSNRKALGGAGRTLRRSLPWELREDCSHGVCQTGRASMRESLII